MNPTEQYAVRIHYEAAKVSTKIIYKAITEYLEASQKGEMKIRKFKKQYGGKEIIPVENKDIKGIKKELKKEGIDFSVINSGEKNSYDLYFKGQDISQVKLGMERYTKRMMKPKRKKSIEEKLKKAVEIAKEKNAQIQSKLKTRAERGINER